MTTVRSLLASLIRHPSITPDDAGCQDIIIEFLNNAGFDCRQYPNAKVSNLYAQWGTQDPLLIFAGHTDVVAPGNLNQWINNPFELYEHQQRLYGRGVADMKGSLACMFIAAREFVKKHPECQGSLGFLITSGEEGDDYAHGTPYVMEQLHQNNTHPNYCIVGEPSSQTHVGDMIKIGRRGSLSGYITLQGKQGHVAYPHLAINPIHLLAPVTHELVNHTWDTGNAHFPPTSFQITHVHAGGQGNNIIPGEITLHFNVRYSTEQTVEQLQKVIQETFTRHHLTPTITWAHSGAPFLTETGSLLNATIDAIKTITHQTPELSTSGGTSDGRFIAPYNVEVIELGLTNASIHQINESIATEELFQLTEIYFKIMENILLPHTIS